MKSVLILTLFFLIFSKVNGQNKIENFILDFEYNSSQGNFKIEITDSFISKKSIYYLNDLNKDTLYKIDTILLAKIKQELSKLGNIKSKEHVLNKTESICTLTISSSEINFIRTFNSNAPPRKLKKLISLLTI